MGCWCFMGKGIWSRIFLVGEQDWQEIGWQTMICTFADLDFSNWDSGPTIMGVYPDFNFLFGYWSERSDLKEVQIIPVDSEFSFSEMLWYAQKSNTSWTSSLLNWGMDLSWGHLQGWGLGRVCAPKPTRTVLLHFFQQKDFYRRKQEDTHNPQSWGTFLLLFTLFNFIKCDNATEKALFALSFLSCLFLHTTHISLPGVVAWLMLLPLVTCSEFNGRNKSYTEVPPDIPPSTTLLNLQDNQISTIQSGAFTGLSNLQTLNLWNNQISIIQSGAFTGLSNLQKLILGHNQISTIHSEAFTGLSNLQILHLYINNISTIQLGSFTGLSNLKELSFHTNQISTIQSGLFVGMGNLQSLLLHHNQISTIQSSFFTGLSNLQLLRLHHNEIFTIQFGSFGGLGNLQTLYLNNNKISTIQSGAFIGLTNLWRLDLYSNQISVIQSGSFTGLSHLQILYLNINLITTIQSGSFTGLSNLQTVILKSNQISTIQSEAFTGLSNLQTLDLSDNNITTSTIQSGIFTELSSLQSLLLNDNRISTVQTGIFSRLSNLENLNLTHNIIVSIREGNFDDTQKLNQLSLFHNNLRTLDPRMFINIRRPFSLHLSEEGTDSDNPWDCGSLCWLKQEESAGTILFGSKEPKCHVGSWVSVDCTQGRPKCYVWISLWPVGCMNL